MRSRLFTVIPLIFCFILPVTTWAADQFKVVKVESWDTLNMRSGPGVKNAVVVQLPSDAKGLSMTGGNKTVGSTHWVEVSWQGKTGWVSKTYLSVQSAATAQPAVAVLTDDQPKTNTPAAAKKEAAPANEVAKVTPNPEKDIVKKKKSGMWILECGNSSPFWKVEVLPEWMSGRLGEHQTGMPITHKRQDHGQYRKVALETEIRGSNRWNRLRMTMNYTKSCYSRLTKKKEAFSVKGMFNNTEISGCCRALQVP